MDIREELFKAINENSDNTFNTKCWNLRLNLYRKEIKKIKDEAFMLCCIYAMLQSRKL